MDQLRRFYVYAYLRSIDSKNGKAGTPYYIGKGSGRRARNPHEDINLPQNRKRDIMILAAGMNEADALQAEMLLIRLHGRIDLGTGILRNRTDGGDGQTGLVHTEETRRKMSASRKGKPRKPHTEETKRLISEMHKGKVFGIRKPHTEEAKYKIRLARAQQASPSDETRRRLSDAFKDRVFSEEHRRKISDGQRARWARQKAA